jgi:methionyl-tRNA synthetase
MAMSIYDISQIGLVLSVAWLIYVVQKSVPAYLAQKGKNLATKEDLKPLTEIAERIRSHFSQANTVHKVQFEAEFQAYQALWSAAHSAVVAHIRWYSLTSQTTNADFEKFCVAQLAFADSAVRFEPFIPESVSTEFKALGELFTDAKIDNSSGIPKTPDAKMAERDAIRQAAQKCAAAIKTRLSEVLVV